MKCWYFRDYIDSAGLNVIEQWLHSLPQSARLEINTRIQYLEVLRRLVRPDTAMLKGECHGLMELRITHNKIRYRPLACYGPGDRQITLLMGAIEKGGRFEPLSACKTALKRKAEIQEPGRTNEHSLAEP